LLKVGKFDKIEFV